MNLALNDMPRRVDLLTEIEFLGQLTQLWQEVGAHQQIQPRMLVGLGGDRASRKYLRGKGVLSDRDGIG
eukprot:3715038-Karenia_brevis.AAC.1